MNDTPEAEAPKALKHILFDQREEALWTILSELFDGDVVGQTAIKSTRGFLRLMHFDHALEAAQIARGRIPYGDLPRFKYFCGVCWRKLKEKP